MPSNKLGRRRHNKGTPPVCHSAAKLNAPPCPPEPPPPDPPQCPPETLYLRFDRKVWIDDENFIWYEFRGSTSSYGGDPAGPPDLIITDGDWEMYVWIHYSCPDHTIQYWIDASFTGSYLEQGTGDAQEVPTESPWIRDIPGEWLTTLDDPHFQCSDAPLP